jgi:histidine ammonia-lyase
MNKTTIRPGHVDLTLLAACAERSTRFVMDAACWPAVDASRAALQALLARHEPIYGINTGFGRLASTRIADADLAQLQLNLVRSHCTGVGAPLAAPVVRRVLLLKAASLAHGVSGVRREVIEALLALLNADVLPVIPSQGSVGASGDLAPLAHMSAVLIGEGEAWFDGARVPGAQALAKAGVAPLALGPKEGLALLNGTQGSTAIALEALARCERLFDAALLAGAMTTDAAQGSDTPFDDRIHAVRGQRGQREAAARYRALLAGSEIRASHLTCHKVQDPYCLRCQPQVMGACLDQIHHVREVLLIEANGVSDNPLIFAGERGQEGAALSGGNFHAEPVAFAADNLALAIAEIGALSERRIAMLMDATISGLPPFLTQHGGLNSGFMIAQVTAAALASENKALAFPRSVDSLPTSANQEDHVSMATGAALRLAPMLENTTRIVSVELLAAAQGIELRRPLRSSKTLEAAFDSVRSVAPFFTSDRALSGEISQVAELIESQRFGG